MRIGVCAVPEKIARPPEGLDYVEGAVADVLRPREGEAAFADRLAALKAAPLPVEAVNCLLPGELKTTGPDADAEAAAAYVATVCRRARRAGVRRIVFGSGGSRQVPEGFDRARASEQLIERLKRWGPLAGEAGVTIVIEPLCRADCNIVNTVGEAVELARAADHPAVRVLADTYHMGRDGDPPAAIRDAGDLLAHAHCAEADGRGPLRPDGEDQRPCFRAMKDAGYDDRVSLECRWDDLGRQLAAAVEELRRQIETA